jgi:hypothetical protein
MKQLQLVAEAQTTRTTFQERLEACRRFSVQSAGIVALTAAWVVAGA